MNNNLASFPGLPRFFVQGYTNLEPWSSHDISLHMDARAHAHANAQNIGTVNQNHTALLTDYNPIPKAAVSNVGCVITAR